MKFPHLKEACTEKMEGTSTKGTSGQPQGAQGKESCQTQMQTILACTISYRFKHRTIQIWWCIRMVLTEGNIIHKHSSMPPWANHLISINIEKSKFLEVSRNQSTWWDIKLQVLVPNLIQKTHFSNLKSILVREIWFKLPVVVMVESRCLKNLQRLPLPKAHKFR